MLCFMRHVSRRTPAAITFVSRWTVPSSNHIHDNNRVMATRSAQRFVAQCSRCDAVRASDPPRRRASDGDRSLCRRYGSAHRPLRSRQVRRPRPGNRGHGLVGQCEGPYARAVRQPSPGFSRARFTQEPCSFRTSSRARPRRIASACAVSCEHAWHALFIRHLLLVPEREQLNRFAPDYDPELRFADPERHGVRSDTVIACDLVRGITLIGGTSYAGEIKKSTFSYLNTIALPAKGVPPMHGSVNLGEAGRVARLFRPLGHGQDDAFVLSTPHYRAKAWSSTRNSRETKEPVMAAFPPSAGLKSHAQHRFDP